MNCRPFHDARRRLPHRGRHPRPFLRYSNGSGGYGCRVYDWPCKLSLNFDGWNFLALPLVKESPVKNYGPGENEYQWQRDGVRGNGIIDFPAKVTAVSVAHRPLALDLLEMRPTSPVIELKGITTCR